MKQRWIVIVGIVIGGIAYWFNPYNELILMGLSIYLILFVGLLSSSFLINLFFRFKPVKIAMIIALGALFSICARILYDTIFWDSTSHNLFPFEILLTSLVIFPAAFVGVYLAELVKWLIRNKF